MHTLSKIKGCLEFSSPIAQSIGDYMGTVSAVNVVELLKVMKQKKQVESFGITIASFSIVKHQILFWFRRFG